MNTYRISKYKSNDMPSIPTWTSYSDIGNTYMGKTFTLNDYIITENNYISCCANFIEKIDRSTMILTNLENYNNLGFYNYQILSKDETKKFIRSCLREECWGKLTSRNLSIHFGYDYYMYVCTDIPYEICKGIANQNSLNIESRNDPYWKGRLFDCVLPNVLSFLLKLLTSIRELFETTHQSGKG